MPCQKLLLSMLLLGAAAGCSPSSNQLDEMKEVLPNIEETDLISAPDLTVSSSSKSNESVDPALEGIIPAQLSIPAIQVDAKVEHVGQLPDGQMDVPKDESNVGWYQPGAKPGDRGNAVLAGHVDNKTGPSVFFHLGDLEAGDLVTVTDEQGLAYDFEVNAVESYPRNNAPLEKVFGTSSKSSLNLITCAGTFDRDAGTHEERMVVYTTLVSE
ncbi:class F sortase [Pseudalkalibacillus hwajinpoensis]|uniref:class F sortase n=1 Tax=Guptibacillus hwajinpoensis TaxID=208199 RepID=UPI001CD3E62A|nr:class F sortase [Pseudalkalibacillus hwajinpoensis]MCA0992589.1 class F sortase [Pseudalkalibacillus hwajinpoensis]